MVNYFKKSKPDGEPSSSKGSRKHLLEDASYEVAQRAQRHEDELNSRFEHTTLDHPGHSKCPKAILEDLEAVQDLVSELMASECWKCGRGVIDKFSVAAWFKKWDGDQRSDRSPSLSTMRCSQEECGP